MPRDFLKDTNDAYDVVVIGSGLAGLTSANILARQGYQVLLLEHHYQLGGMATWFKRAGGHIFDISLHGFPHGMIKSCRKYWTPEIAESIVQLKGVRFENPQFSLRTTFTREDFTRILVEHFGISLTTVMVPPWLQGVIADQGWRQGLLALAGIAGLIGLPLVLALMPGSVSVRGSGSPNGKTDWHFLKDRGFVQMTLASLCISVATSGTIGHLSPMLQANGLTAKTAALGISTFAIGQLIGKLGGGWMLDRYNPRIVASVVNAVPALAFVLFLTAGSATAPLLLATSLLGLMQGADVSVFAFLVARRFPIAQFGTVLGSLHGISWIGTAVGLVGFGLSFDALNSYWLAQSLSIGALLTAALLLLTLRLPVQGNTASAGKTRD